MTGCYFEPFEIFYSGFDFDDFDVSNSETLLTLNDIVENHPTQ